MLKRPHLRKLPVKECRENASSVQIHPLQLTSFLFLSQNPHSPSYPLYKVGASTHYFIYIYKGLDQKRETLKKNVEHHIAPVAYRVFGLGLHDHMENGQIQCEHILPSLYIGSDNLYIHPLCISLPFIIV